MPTECEWEFAAGGGSSEEHDRYKYAGSNNVGDVAWYYDNSGSEAHPVGTKRANALGIYDMSGNIAEWCFDVNVSFGTGELTNPVHFDSTDGCRIYRGGTLGTSMNPDSLILWQHNVNYPTRQGSYEISYTNGGRNLFIVGLRIARNAE